MKTAAFSFALVMAGIPAAAQNSGDPAGWTVQHRKGEYACAASGPQMGGGQTVVFNYGPQLHLLIALPGSSGPQESAGGGRQPVVIALRPDDKPEIKVNALADGALLDMIVTRDLNDQIEHATFLTVLAGKAKQTFPVSNLGQAFDATLRCAGMPIRAELKAKAPQPIPKAGEWTIQDFVPPTDKCAIRRNGDQIDISLMIDPSGKILLSGGKPNWIVPTGSIDIALQIDQTPPRSMSVIAADNVMIAVFSDQADIERLVKAKTLRWTYRGTTLEGLVDGLDIALDALKACDARKRAPSR